MWDARARARANIASASAILATAAAAAAAFSGRARGCSLRVAPLCHAADTTTTPLVSLSVSSCRANSENQPGLAVGRGGVELTTLEVARAPLAAVLGPPSCPLTPTAPCPKHHRSAHVTQRLWIHWTGRDDDGCVFFGRRLLFYWGLPPLTVPPSLSLPHVCLPGSLSRVRTS